PGCITPTLTVYAPVAVVASTVQVVWKDWVLPAGRLWLSQKRWYTLLPPALNTSMSTRALSAVLLVTLALSVTLWPAATLLVEVVAVAVTLAAAVATLVAD